MIWAHLCMHTKNLCVCVSFTIWHEKEFTICSLMKAFNGRATEVWAGLLYSQTHLPSPLSPSLKNKKQELELRTGAVVIKGHSHLHQIHSFVWLCRWLYRNALIHSIVDGYLSYFQIFVLIKNVAKIFLDLLLGEHIHTFLLGIYVGVELLGHNIYESSVWTAQTFFKLHVPIYISLTVYKNSSCYIVSPTLAEKERQSGRTYTIRYKQLL